MAPGIFVSLSRLFIYLFAAVIVGYTLLALVVFRVVITPALQTIELAEAEDRVARVEQAIDAELARLEQQSLAWVVRHGVRPIPETTGERTGGSGNTMDLQLLGHLDAASASEIAGIRLDPPGSGFTRFNILSDEMASGRAVTQLVGDPRGAASGVVSTEWGLMLVAAIAPRSSEPRTHEDRMIFGRTLAGATLSRLREVANIEFSVFPAADLGPSAQVESVGLDDREPGDVHIRDYGGRMSAVKLQPDATGRPGWAIAVPHLREVSALGRTAISAAVILIAGVGIIVVACVWSLLQTRFAGPLAQLTEHVARLRRSGDLSLQFAPLPTAEVGLLGAALNELARNLERARERLQDAAYVEGSAENSRQSIEQLQTALRDIAGTVAQPIAEMDGESSARFLSEVEALAADENFAQGREKRLVDYLHLCAEKLDAEHAQLLENMRTIAEHASATAEARSG